MLSVLLQTNRTDINPSAAIHLPARAGHRHWQERGTKRRRKQANEESWKHFCDSAVHCQMNISITQVFADATKPSSGVLFTVRSSAARHIRAADTRSPFLRRPFLPRRPWPRMATRLSAASNKASGNAPSGPGTAICNRPSPNVVRLALEVRRECGAWRLRQRTTTGHRSQPVIP